MRLSDYIRTKRIELEMLERSLKETLPQEPGHYVDQYNRPWELADNGYWYTTKYGSAASERDWLYIYDCAPFNKNIYKET